MLTLQENELLTRTGPGTPMGQVMRRYWVPALLSWELPEPDCPPIRVRLLGENLVAFRDTNGRIGFLDEFCPHRGTSLWLGRNEECGLRCVYHGWKFDVDGNCVDQMNEPVQFKEKVHATAYPSLELGDVVWVYMGPPGRAPAPPRFEWTQVPPEQRTVTKVVEECNWLQALEGGIDTSHAPILHRALRSNPSQPGIPLDDAFVQAGAPILQVDTTDYGYRYFGVRDLDTDRVYARGYHYVMPWTQLRPGGRGKYNQTHGHFWVPIDDHTCLVWNWYYSFNGPLAKEDQDPQGSGNSFTTDIDAANGFRARRNRSNDWLIDRQAQKTDTFTGIAGVNTQDRAVQELMGPIVDRSREHLGPADQAVIAARKLLQQAVRTVSDGADPPGVAPTYYDLRAIDAILPKDVSWHEALCREMYPTPT